MLPLFVELNHACGVPCAIQGPKDGIIQSFKDGSKFNIATSFQWTSPRTNFLKMIVYKKIQPQATNFSKPIGSFLIYTYSHIHKSTEGVLT